MTKLPSFQFYPGDWMKDPSLRACSIAARGLWTDMLCLMFESVRRGYLQHATGKPVSPEQLARMTGCSAEEVSRLLQELEDSGVFSRTEHGVIYSRRMARDEGKREKCREAGKRGGNPNLVVSPLKGDPKGGVKGGSKGDANRIPTPSSSSSSSETPTPLRGAGGGASVKPSGMGGSGGSLRDVTAEELRDTGKLRERIRTLIAAGILPDTENDRLMAVAAAERALAKGTNPPALWVRIVKGKSWDLLAGDEIDRARKRISDWKSQRAGMDPAVAAAVNRVAESSQGSEVTNHET